MSEPKSIKDIILDISIDKNEPIGKTFIQCPFIQAELLRQGKLSLDDLNDEQIRNLVEHTAEVYQTFPVNAEEQPIGKNQLKQQYFDALPHNFDKQTALSVAQTLNIPHKTAERYLKQWTLSARTVLNTDGMGNRE